MIGLPGKSKEQSDGYLSNFFKEKKHLIVLIIIA